MMDLRDSTTGLRDQKIGKLLWQFSLPAIVGTLVNGLYNIVDRIFVGQGVGSLAIAATTVSMPIVIFLFAFSMLIGIGALALVSIRLGEQKKEEAEKIVGNALILLILSPAIFALIFFLFPEQILVLLGAGPEVMPYALDFTGIIMIGFIFGSFSYGMNNFIRAEGKPRIAMCTQILGAIVNVILNYVFIFKFGWGIKGSALGTLCGQLISALWVMGYFLSGRNYLKILKKNLKPSLSLIIMIFTIGFGPFSMQIASSIQQLILNKTLISYGGDLALSAVGILMSVLMVLVMPIIGISQGAQPIIGYNYGARQYDRVKQTLKNAVIAGTCLAVLSFAIIRIWPTQIVELFGKGDADLISLTTHAISIYFMMLPIVAFQVLGSGYFQAVGKAIQSTILSLSRQVLFFIPLLLVLPHFYGIEGVWYTAPIADALAVLLTAAVIFFEMKSLPGQKKIVQKELTSQG